MHSPEDLPFGLPDDHIHFVIDRYAGTHFRSVQRRGYSKRLLVLDTGLQDLETHYRSMLSDSRPTRLANYTIGREKYPFTYTGVLAHDIEMASNLEKNWSSWNCQKSKSLDYWLQIHKQWGLDATSIAPTITGTSK
jgi:hypothetical protein